MPRFVNNAHKATESLVFTGYWNAGNNTDHEIVGQTEAHLGSNGHIEVMKKYVNLAS